jgi:hypothetical protein
MAGSLENRQRIIRLTFKVRSRDFRQGLGFDPAEQRWISQVLTAVAHAGELTVVAGHYRPGVPFPDLISDSTFHI